MGRGGERVQVSHPLPSPQCHGGITTALIFNDGNRRLGPSTTKECIRRNPRKRVLNTSCNHCSLPSLHRVLRGQDAAIMSRPAQPSPVASAASKCNTVLLNQPLKPALFRVYGLIGPCCKSSGLCLFTSKNTSILLDLRVDEQLGLPKLDYLQLMR